MQKKSYKKYLPLCALLLAITMLPVVVQKQVCQQTVALLSPLWKQIGNCFSSNARETKGQNALRYENENHSLRLEITKLRALLEQTKTLEELTKEKNLYQQLGPVRRYEEAYFLCKSLQKGLPARVIYRDPAHWSSALWINVGERTNEALHEKIIQKNSPVVIGRAVVGVIDEVGKEQSRVRLITDVGLKPSVRAVRGYPQHIVIQEQIERLLRSLQADQEGTYPEKIASLCTQLEGAKKYFSEMTPSWYLAKGVLQGQGTPLWRCTKNTLRGFGFNYDFADEEGPTKTKASFLQEGDLLITTGMDGVFPAGLRVAQVTRLLPLREGSYTYEIEAIPMIRNMNEISSVFILPSISPSLLR